MTHAPFSFAKALTCARVGGALTIGLLLCLTPNRHAIGQQASQSSSPDADLLIYAAHINRTPSQSWPGFGMYLGNGLVLTAAHVPGNFADTKPRAIIAGKDLPTTLVKQGSLDGVDLTLLSVDPNALPVSMRMRRLPLCRRPASAGEAVVVVTPESAVRSRVLPPSAVPPDLRGRFATVIGDVAATGNSGSGVLDAGRGCLLGIISRKISVTRRGVRPGAPVKTMDIAKYFVPADDIRAFIPTGVSF